ncbi:ATP-dependent DNA helicase RecG [Ilyobacter polytropus]|uniref:ATP-dependent DNA helicase RecG n=1 Tax=Ilyobacter polytropus (strain ATCC 51220 / DSM 2926 / LMG 16218 / CuHBu1) TaxID=572544 RepID=E3HA63_ILYPC|nr:ATP-dependent DNA helicase RecG [Ilyobacter polytropus]ADO83468.1 ATP-dependent DNA helicase RecG [Ilyobacter polytropus DSM 2926]
MERYDRVFEPLGNFELKGITDKSIEKLKNLGIVTLYDLFYYFPRNYEDRTNFKSINQLKEGEYAVIKGKLFGIETLRTRTRKTMIKAKVSDGTGFVELVWFQMPYLKKSLKMGDEYIFIGNVKRGYNYQMTNPEYRKYAESKGVSKEILPIYSSNKDFNQRSLRKIVKTALDSYTELFQENIPEEILKKYSIADRKKALKDIHFPKNTRDIEEAKRRFAIEELLILETGILEKRFAIDSMNNEMYVLEDNKNLVKKFLGNLGYSLTKAQKRVVTEIYKELNNGKIINRLLQGDVGSGKTIVAVIMLLYMIENSYQGVFMAPTEILATQHYLSIADTLLELGIRVELLTGSVKGRKKDAILEDIKNGKIDLIVGTHSLIEDNVEFHKLGLIVIDEQHRFGVIQRKKLREKGVIANLIVMSATPIPRSLALSIYGDLDVSIIDEMPPGRTPVKTKWINSSSDAEKAYSFIQKKLTEGRQAYFVAPLIEESEKLSFKSVQELFKEVTRRFPQCRAGLLHGRMKNSEKDEIMHFFKNHKLDILVATTVIEVGINVPNASIMVINNTERFGLSALHQLRGRVGRGIHPSYCFLFSETDNDVSKSRLMIMESTTDGFKIAEEDLRLRKPGEIFGIRQSGFSDLKFIDIIHDVKTIKMVRDIAYEYLRKNSGKIKNTHLRIDIDNKFLENL